MNFVFSLLNVNTVFFTVLHYPMSYIEFFGTIFNLWSVWLVAKKNILTWPVGLVGVVLFLILFYQIQLYSDMIEQAYYLLTGFWGWWVWHTAGKVAEDSGDVTTQSSSFHEQFSFLCITILGTVALRSFTLSVPQWLPSIFPEPPAYPLVDALTTVMSFVATYLMIKRKLSCWYYWIIVDVVGIGLYFAKDVKFLSLLYVIFLMMAVKGLLEWKKSVPSLPVASEA